MAIVGLQTVASKPTVQTAKGQSPIMLAAGFRKRKFE